MRMKNTYVTVYHDSFRQVTSLKVVIFFSINFKKFLSGKRSHVAKIGKGTFKKVKTFY